MRLGGPIRLCFIMLLPAAGCGRQANSVEPRDTALVQTMQAGGQALAMGRPKQAIDQYRQAYTLALARNDVHAIGDCGYNLAVVQLANNDALEALHTVARTRDALSIRASPGFPELDLVEASALFRLGRLSDADRVAQRAQDAATDPATLARASYVRGLVAEARGDPVAMALALHAFGQPTAPSPSWEADHAELQGRLELLHGHYAQAAILAEQAAAIQRTQLNYHAMAEALAVAAKAQQSAGDVQAAADLYLQAGESAAARDDTASAERWLRSAAGPGASMSTRRTAQDALAAIHKAQ